jgi:hypothetical protein
MWLDLARYSDTTGFEKDPHRDIWPFRDWVIRAFNEDMPFDRFTVKQLAGDLVENPEAGDLIATAFHRNTQNNSEGGTDDEEYRMASVLDRINTTWTVWNATTFGCVQCHAHPYDPIPHEDYYRFMDFFNNTEDVDIDSDFPRTKVADDPKLQPEAIRLEQRIRQRREEWNGAMLELARKVEGWRPVSFAKAAVEPRTGSLTQQPDHVLVTSGTTTPTAVFKLEAQAAPFSLIRIEIFPEQDDPAKRGGRGAVISGLEVAYLGAGGKRTVVPLEEVVADFIAGPFDPNDSLGFGDYPMTQRPRTAWFVPRSPAAPAPGDRLVEVTIRHGAKCNGGQGTVLPRFRISVSDDGTLISRKDSAGHRQLSKELGELRKQYEAIPGLTIPVMQERSGAARRETRVFIRGNRMTLDQPVTAGIPEIFGGERQPANRLEMARWIVSDDNPMAARVLANRLWAEMFGTGIVETLEDFGSSGALPTHPALLDYLALRLRDHHAWHLKPFLREIVLSATYGQIGKATPELVARDPRNRLLARGPRNRLTAEMVRDQALVISGLLSPRMYGKPVFPPQPEGIWRSVYSGAKWTSSKGPDLFRRALYTYNKRTSGYPAYLTFDSSARDVCLARRVPTNTPLQALVTLNDPAHLEFARAFAKRMSEAESDPAARLAWGYRMLTLKEPDPEVLAVLESLHADAVAEYEQSPGEASKLAPTAAGAALVLVANTLLNSDVALNR